MRLLVVTMSAEMESLVAGMLGAEVRVLEPLKSVLAL